MAQWLMPAVTSFAPEDIGKIRDTILVDVYRVSAEPGGAAAFAAILSGR
jgi:hypothetical protein